MMNSFRSRVTPVGRGEVIILLLLVAGIFLIYQPAWNADFIWDDDAHLTAHKCIVGPLGFKEIWTTSEANYFPLVLTTFWLMNKLFGLDPTAFHLTGIALHATCAVLLWYLLRLLRVPGAVFGAAIWAFHPIQVESVAWVSEIINTQSCLFFLLALIFGVRWVDLDSRASLGIALICGAGALLSKPSTVGLPVVLGLCTWWMRGTMRWRDVYWLAPFFLMSLAVSGWTIWEQRFHSGAQGDEWSNSFLERIAIAGRVFWFYLGKLIWPAPLIFIYPRWSFRQLDVVSLLPSLLVVASAIFVWIRRYYMRHVLLSFGYYFVMIFPVMGFFNVYFFRYSYVADHFVYLGSIGPIAFVCGSINFFLNDQRASLRSGLFAGTLLLSALSVYAFIHARSFRDSDTLWRATLRRNPQSFLAWNNLGVSLLARESFFEAEKMFRQALEIAPAVAETHFNLGKCLNGQGKHLDAVEAFQAAVRLQPSLESARVSLGNTLALMPGRQDEAITHYNAALLINPANSEVHTNLAVVLGQIEGRLDEAIRHGLTAVQLSPHTAAAHLNVGVLLARIPSRLGDAIVHFREAVRLKSDYVKAYINLGLALAARPGGSDEAIRAYETALEIEPSSAVAHNNLGVALAQLQRWEAAQKHFEEAVRIAPDFDDAQSNLSVVRKR
jgi:protein O-mannosyl-transferase